MGVAPPCNGAVGRAGFVSDEVLLGCEDIECLFDGCGVKVEDWLELSGGAGQEILGEYL